MEFEKQSLNILHYVRFLKEGLLKRLKNIEDKNKQQLELIKNQGEKQTNLINKSNLESGSKKLEIESVLNLQAKQLIDEINKEFKNNED